MQVLKKVFREGRLEFLSTPEEIRGTRCPRFRDIGVSRQRDNAGLNLQGLHDVRTTLLRQTLLERLSRVSQARSTPRASPHPRCLPFKEVPLMQTHSSSHPTPQALLERTPHTATRTTRRTLLALATLIAAGTLTSASSAQVQTYYRIQLKSNGQYLDADHCGSPVTLNPGSTYANGACEAWRFIPAGGGWYKIQLKANGQFLDAAYCSSPIGLNPGSTYADGACQKWRLVPAGGGWSRLQLKINGQFLDADHCTPTLGLNPGSTYADGACQLWKLVPMPVRFD